MTNDQKRNQIEESLLNGQIEQAKEQFKRMSKTERKSFASDRAIGLYYLTQGESNGGAHTNAIRLAEFLIQNI